MSRFRPAHFAQERDFTCGAACVRMLFDYWGESPVSERRLQRELRADRVKGIEPLEIRDWFLRRGFRAEVCENETYGRLLKRCLSGWEAIICWLDWDGHYCLVEQIRRDFVDLADPAATANFRPEGFTLASRAYFKQMWRTPGVGKRGEVIYVKKETL